MTYLLINALDSLYRLMIFCMLARERASYHKQKKEDVDQKDEQYTDICRTVGSGPIRVGTPISLNSDIYSMLFVSCFYAEHLYYYKYIEGQEEHEQ